MYYELYIDVLFLVNFMMDSLLLLSVNQVLKCPTTRGRIFLGGALGALLTCVVTVVPMPGVIKLIIFHAVINTFMIKTGLKIKGKKQFWKAFGLLYIAAFLYGGFCGISSLCARGKPVFCDSRGQLLSDTGNLEIPDQTADSAGKDM